MIKLLFSLIAILFGLSGCTAHQVEPRISMQPPLYVKQETHCRVRPKEQTSGHEGSIYGRGENPLFYDKKAMRVNDIVTVVINESTFQSSQGDKKISDSSQNRMGGGVFSGALAGPLNGLTDIGFKTGSNNSFSATGRNSRNEKFSTTITARVVKVLDNGNYFIAGSRELLLNGTKQIVEITGVIRPYDIDETNTIDSKYIADAKIHYETEGDIREAVRKPWGSRIVESIWPF